jgi:hypothetical protein
MRAHSEVYDKAGLAAAAITFKLVSAPAFYKPALLFS